MNNATGVAERPSPKKVADEFLEEHKQDYSTRLRPHLDRFLSSDENWAKIFDTFVYGGSGPRGNDENYYGTFEQVFVRVFRGGLARAFINEELEVLQKYQQREGIELIGEEIGDFGDRFGRNLQYLVIELAKENDMYFTWRQEIAGE
jgi:hypothetical protein